MQPQQSSVANGSHEAAYIRCKCTQTYYLADIKYLIWNWLLRRIHFTPLLLCCQGTGRIDDTPSTLGEQIKEYRCLSFPPHQANKTGRFPESSPDRKGACLMPRRGFTGENEIKKKAVSIVAQENERHHSYIMPSRFTWILLR